MNQDRRRPALILSAHTYNKKVGLCLVCSVTSHIKGYPFEVLIPEGEIIRGAILADQIKSLDWKARQAEFVCSIPDEVVEEVLDKIADLLEM